MLKLTTLLTASTEEIVTNFILLEVTTGNYYDIIEIHSIQLIMLGHYQMHSLYYAVVDSEHYIAVPKLLLL